ncbi:hypothetical protein Ahy_A05g024722 [Arachis hypogaea]|uniref:Uncharacterized protein n=1 Tax=Arachis hypogaea TaxID=3818 RepID=A0A445D6J5_ARAHY|nr:hypothetical protein Ahy_A05g024722 [Arachis hypogaea]
MRAGIKFTNKDPLSVFIRPSMSFVDFQNTILQKLGLHRIKRVDKLFYRILISVVRDGVKDDSFVIESGEDLQVLFHYRRKFPKVRTHELWPRGSNQNHQSVSMAAISSSTPIVAFSSRHVMASAKDLVASLPFVSGEVGEPDVVEDILGDDDDVEPVMINDDSDDDIGRSTSIGAGGALSLGTQQYLSHTTLDLDAIRQQGLVKQRHGRMILYAL